MEVFRIYTEDLNRAGIEALVSQRFPGFTIIPANGYWEGHHEESLVIEVIAPGNERSVKVVHELAESIRELNNQDSVLVTRARVDSHLIERPKIKVLTEELKRASR